MVSIAVNGACGRMGRAVAAEVIIAGDLTLSACIESSGNPDIGTDIGRIVGLPPAGVVVSGGYGGGADVLVDFSTPRAALAVLDVCREKGTAAVVGTTGFTEAETAAIMAASADVPILLASNMSIGVNLLLSLVAQAAELLGDDYDVEIVEAHHRHKKDSPSGTALSLAAAAARALGLDPAEVFRYGREGIVGERGSKEIGIHAVRGGDEIGEHSVKFMADGERIEFLHRVTDRRVFARGAVRAARFVAGRGEGFYTIADMIDGGGL